VSFRARIAWFGTAVVAVALALLGALVVLLAVRGGASDRDNALAARADEAVASLADAGPEAFSPRAVTAPVDLARSEEVFVLIADADGVPIAGTGEVEGAPPPIPLAARDAATGDGKATVELVAGRSFRVAVRPWERPDLGLRGYVLAGQSTQRLRNDVGGIVVFLVISAVVTLAAAFAASWRAAGRALRPLRAMAATADEIGGAADLGRRLPAPRAKDELGRLATSFNGMLGRIEATHADLAAALAREQRFVADASHELRTPLTSIRANADFLLHRTGAAAGDRAAAVGDIAAESARMGALVEDLLTLARADAGQPVGLAPLDPIPVVEGVCARALRLYPGRTIACDLGQGGAANLARVLGNDEALGRLVWILVENAVVHGGVAARVGVGLASDAQNVTIRVSDDGPGIPATELGRVFERFYRADPARGGPGVGLGLPIARWLAGALGGRVHALPNDGPGVSFFVELPLVHVANDRT